VRKAVVAAGYKIAIDESWGSAESSKDLAQVHRYTTHRRWKQALDRCRASGEAPGEKLQENRQTPLTWPIGQEYIMQASGADACESRV
jgi:hypothetical protein